MLTIQDSADIILNQCHLDVVRRALCSALAPAKDHTAGYSSSQTTQILHLFTEQRHLVGDKTNLVRMSSPTWVGKTNPSSI